MGRLWLRFALCVYALMYAICLPLALGIEDSYSDYHSIKPIIFPIITKKGKKELAKKIFHRALIKASKKTHLGSHFLLAKAFKKLQASVEVKDVKRCRKFFKIPFFSASIARLSAV